MIHVGDLSRDRRSTLHRSQNSVLLYSCSCLSAINEASIRCLHVYPFKNNNLDLKISNNESKYHSSKTDHRSQFVLFYAANKRGSASNIHAGPSAGKSHHGKIPSECSGESIKPPPPLP